mmetsp:Transcript_25025/g.71995  ORF Transcript_25025/g.71995 Transcript_25025/m.71995 type:complete len:342 (-) Transcript_25025:439-1464(-)
MLLGCSGGQLLEIVDELVDIGIEHHLQGNLAELGHWFLVHSLEHLRPMAVQDRLRTESLEEGEPPFEVLNALSQLLRDLLHGAHVVIVEGLDHLVHILVPSVQQLLDLCRVEASHGLRQPIDLTLLELDDRVPQLVVRGVVVDHAVQLEVVCDRKTEQLLAIDIRLRPLNALVQGGPQLVDLGLVVRQALLVVLVVLPHLSQDLAPIAHVIVELHLLTFEHSDLGDVPVDEEVPHPDGVVTRTCHKALRRWSPSGAANGRRVTLEWLGTRLAAYSGVQLHLDVLARSNDCCGIGRPNNEVCEALNRVDHLCELRGVVFRGEIPNSDGGVCAARCEAVRVLR